LAYKNGSSPIEEPLANRRASLWKYVKIGNRWKFCRPAIKPDWVRVNGHQELHPEGNYYVQHIESAKQVWKNVGDERAPTTNQNGEQMLSDETFADISGRSIGATR